MMRLQLNIPQLCTGVTIVAAAMLQRVVKDLHCIKGEAMNLRQQKLIYATQTKKVFTGVTILAAAMLQRVVQDLHYIKAEAISLRKQKLICVTYENSKRPSEINILVGLRAVKHVRTSKM